MKRLVNLKISIHRLFIFICLSVPCHILRADKVDIKLNDVCDRNITRKVKCNIGIFTKQFNNNNCEMITLSAFQEPFSQNCCYHYQFNTSEVQFRENNVTCCFPYDDKFIKCTKWKLDSTEFLINHNQLILRTKYENNNYNCYSLGEYRLNFDNSAHVCVPNSLLPLNIILKLDLLFILCAFISTLTLFTSLVSYIICPFRRHDSKSLICHMICFLCYFVVKLIFETVPTATCHLYLSTLHQFSLLAGNNWLNVISYDIWKKFEPNKTLQRTNTDSARIFCYRCCYCFGLACLLLTVEFILVYTEVLGPLDIKPGIFVFTWSSIYFFLCLTVMQSVNIILFILTFINIKKMTTERAKVYVEVNRKIISVFRRLFIVECVVYGIVLIERIPIHEILTILANFLLIMQGFYFFLVYETNSLISLLKSCFHRLVNQSKRITNT